MPELVSQSEFARRIGRSRQYVSKLVTQGKIILRDKKVDVVQAKKDLKDIEDPRRPKQRKIQKKASSKKPEASKKKGEPKEKNAPGYMGDEKAIPILGVSLAKKEFYRAEQERVKTLETVGELVPAEEVKKAAFKWGRDLRDAVLEVPPRVAKQVAALDDPHEITQLLLKELRNALSTGGFEGAAA